MATTRRPAARTLRDALSNARGLLLDLDGVLVLKGDTLPGAVESLRRLDEAAFPYLILTNTSLVSRRTLARQLQAGGLPVPPDRIVTAASATADYVRREFRGRPLYVLASPDALTEFEGLRLLSHDEAGAFEARAAAVVVGDAGEDFTPRNMLSAFRLLRSGAAFLAMHKNRWWLTPDGPTLDAGGYVAGLEFATEREALVVGKPSAPVFLEGARHLAAQLGGPTARRTAPAAAPAEFAMVGDDVWNDVLGAMDAGLRGIFVRSGKHGDAELRSAGASGRPVEAIAPSIVEVVDEVLRQR